MKQITREWIDLFLLAILAIIAVAMLNAVVGCTQRQVTVLVVPMRFRGATVCDRNGNPTILINPEVVGTKEEPAVMVHEYTHVSQMTRLGCRKTLERASQDSLYKFDMEAEAYCADMEYRVRVMGQDREWLIRVLLPYLQREYRPSWTLEFIRSRLPCGGANETAPRDSG